jgi:putative transposase
MIPPHYTSQTCPACAHVDAQNRRRQSEFVCVECGFREHADLVGSINVLRAGHARIACEVSSEVRLPAAGTTPDRSAGSIPVPRCLGILGIHAGEDVNHTSAKSPGIDSVGWIAGRP